MVCCNDTTFNYSNIFCAPTQSEAAPTSCYTATFIYLFIFNSAIVSYCRQTSAFRMTVPAVSQQDCLAHSEMQSRSWSLAGSSPPSRWAPAGDRPHLLFNCCITQRWDTADLLQHAAVRDECDIHQSTTEVGQWSTMSLNFYRCYRRGALMIYCHFWTQKEAEGTALVQARTHWTPCYPPICLLASNMDLSSIFKIEHILFNCLCGKWILVKLQC